MRHQHPTAHIFALVLALAGALSLELACSSSDPTVPGTPAPSGDAGADAAPSEEADSGSVSVDAGGDAAPAPKDFGEPCDDNAECKSGACFSGGNASYCSIKCAPAGDTSTDCPTPLTTGECNNKGFCKKP
jgi:hypothetical protein